MNKNVKVLGFVVIIFLLIAISFVGVQQLAVTGTIGNTVIEFPDMMCNNQEDCINQFLTSGTGTQEEIQSAILNNDAKIECDEICVVTIK